MSADELERLDDEAQGTLVPVVFAHTEGEAEKYCQLLEDHDIPVVIDEEYEPPDPSSARRVGEIIPVLVPESFLEDARDFIAEFNELNTLVDEDEEEDEGEDVFDEDSGYGPTDLEGGSEKLSFLPDDEDEANEEDQPS